MDTLESNMKETTENAEKKIKTVCMTY